MKKSINDMLDKHYESKGYREWNEPEIDVPNFYKPKKNYCYAITISLLTIAFTILLLMSMHTAQTEAVNGWVN